MLKAELKKFVQPVLILVAILISIVFYQLELNWLYTYWPNGALVPIYQYADDWHDRFGKTMSDADFDAVQQEYELLREETGQILAKSELGKENNIKSYEDFEEKESHLVEGSIDELSAADRLERENFRELELVAEQNVYKIQAYQWIEKAMSKFESEEAFFKDKNVSDQDKKLLSDYLLKEQGWRNNLPEYLSGQVSSHISKILNLTLIIMSLLLPAVFIKDNILKIKATQWTSKKGRSLVKVQYLAMQLTGFVVITLGLLVFLGPILATEFTRYFSSGLNSFFTEISTFGTNYSYTSLTFGQLLLLLIGFVYLLGFSFSNILFFISQTSKNYLTMLMKVIPMLVIFVIASDTIIMKALHLDNRLYEITQLLNVEIYATCAILIASLILGTLSIRKIKKQELLE